MDKELEEWHKLHLFHLYSGSYKTNDVAKCLSVSPRTIQRWLKEKTKPSKDQLVKIKQYLIEKELKD